MKVSIFGLGYVGCVSAACLARDGHRVTGIDVNPQKLDALKAGRSTVIEPGLNELVRQSVDAGRLQVGMDARAAVHNSDVSMICVGTPSNDNGSLGLQYIEKVCGEIGRALADAPAYHVVVVRSTVLPGTLRELLIPILEQTSGGRAGTDFGVCMNPEFLREGCAIEDYDHPEQIVIGQFDQQSGDVAARLYQGIDASVVRTPIENAEMVKYVCNAFHALKIAFANEIGNLCKAHNIDGREVMEVFCQDRRLNISAKYLQPGFAFGGSCLPKDLRAMVYQAKQHDLECPLLSSVLLSNQQQIARGIEMVEHTGKNRIGVLGLSFKAGTDDVRESPVVPLVETLVGRGYKVSLYDEMVDPERLIGANKAFLERELPHIASLMRPSIDEVVAESEVLVVTNGSPAFRRALALADQRQIVVDLAGVDINETQKLNGNYEGICW